MKYQQIQLQGICEFVSGGTPDTKVEAYWQGDIPWITSGDIQDNRITMPREHITPLAIQKSATNLIPRRSVLLATRTGVGKVAINDFDICISQDFTALIPDSSKLIPEFLYYGIQANRKYLHRNQRGATIQGVTREVVHGLSLALPPLADQKRIADILENADHLRRLRHFTRKLGDSFLQSVFLEMFGNPVRNPRGWNEALLSDLGSLDRGRSKHRPRNAPELYGGPYPFIQTGDIANSSGYLRTYGQTYSEEGLLQSKMWPKGTLCITIAANIALTAISTFETCFPDSVVGFIPNDGTAGEFIQYWFSFIQGVLEKSAPEFAQKNINLKILRSLKVLKPPIELQQKFTEIVHEYEQVRLMQVESGRQSDQLFQSLLNRAFRGGH